MVTALVDQTTVVVVLIVCIAVLTTGYIKHTHPRKEVSILRVVGKIAATDAVLRIGGDKVALIIYLTIVHIGIVAGIGYRIFITCLFADGTKD